MAIIIKIKKSAWAIVLGGSLLDSTLLAGSWTPVEGDLELAEKLAEKTATTMVPKLKKEKASVVFINLQSCSQSNGWCDVYRSNLESAFISKGIKFLPEDKSSEIRAKIAAENLYQHASLQVDVNKAVELGKQNAVHAFITIGISSDENSIRGAISSVSIREGVVTISENVQMKIQRTTTRSIGSWLIGGTITAAGIFGAYYDHSNSYKQKQAADKLYKKYEEAKTPEDATRERNAAEEKDKEVIKNDNIAYASWAVILIGGWYLLATGQDEVSYKFVDVSNNAKPVMNMTAISFQPWFSDRSVGLGLTYEY